MSTSTGPSRKRCSETPRISRDRRSSCVRTSPIDSGGHRSSSIEPPSPRVAVTSTTRFPNETAVAIRPAERKMSSSGSAQMPTLVPSDAMSVIDPPGRSSERKSAADAPDTPSEPRPVPSALVDQLRDALEERIGHGTLGTSVAHELLEMFAELRAIEARGAIAEVVLDPLGHRRVDLA